MEYYYVLYALRLFNVFNVYSVSLTSTFEGPLKYPYIVTKDLIPIQAKARNTTITNVMIHKIIATGKNTDIPRNKKNPSAIVIPTPANAIIPAKHKTVHPMKIAVGTEQKVKKV
ncbi:unnamed protein product [Rhizophagus irregularis]|nr:unnamed protein product [Rhizophagus irregularis]